MTRVPAPALICALVAATAFGTAEAATAQSNFDPSADFSVFHTFTIKAGTPAQTPWGQKAIEEAVTAELRTKGLSPATEHPDLVVFTHVQHSVEKQIDFQSYGYRTWGGGWGGYGSTTGRVIEYPIGTLIVDLVRASDQALVWRGSVSDVLPSKQEKVAKLVPKAVTKLFKKYPPTAAK